MKKIFWSYNRFEYIRGILTSELWRTKFARAPGDRDQSRLFQLIENSFIKYFEYYLHYTMLINNDRKNYEGSWVIGKYRNTFDNVAEIFFRLSTITFDLQKSILCLLILYLVVVTRRLL